MNIFICWSGHRGLLVAEVLQDWLKQVFPTCIEVHVSTDIEKGAIWREELERFLLGSRAGLLCITPEALASPWVSFEAGFLARAIGAAQQSPDEPAGQLFTFLLGAKAGDLNGPLAAYQSTDASDQRDTERLIRALLKLIPQQERDGAKLIDHLTVSWPKHWANLRSRLAVIPKAPLLEAYPGFAELFRRKTFEEPIDECMSQEWLYRYCGVRDTLTALRERQPRIEGACRRYVRELTHALISELDGYANSQSRLIGSSFPLADSGKLELPEGLRRTCETRRCAVRRLVARLEDSPPFFDEAVRFDAADNLEEAKSILHRLEPRVRDLAKLMHGRKLDSSWPEQAACFRLVSDSKASNEPPRVHDPRAVDLDLHWRTSRWAFDRVMYAVYLRCCFQAGANGHVSEELSLRALEFAEEQLDVVRAQNLDASQEPKLPGFGISIRLMPLQCALASVEAAGVHTCTAEVRDRVRELAENVMTVLDERKCEHEFAWRNAKRIGELASQCPERDVRQASAYAQ